MSFSLQSIAFKKLIATFEGAGSCGAVEPVPGGERDHPTWPEGWQGSGQVPGEESYIFISWVAPPTIVQDKKKSLDLPLYVQVICYFFQDYLKSTCFRWTSRSWRTLWRIESRNMLLCNTLGTRRRSKSNLIHHHTLLFTQYLWCSGHFLTACPRKCKSFVGDPISNPGCWQSTEWWAKGWDPPWQTSKMSQLTSGPPRILTNILCILINIPCILINIPFILTIILNFCQAHSDARCFLLAV